MKMTYMPRKSSGRPQTELLIVIIMVWGLGGLSTADFSLIELSQ